MRVGSLHVEMCKELQTLSSIKTQFLPTIIAMLFVHHVACHCSEGEHILCPVGLKEKKWQREFIPVKRTCNQYQQRYRRTLKLRKLQKILLLCGVNRGLVLVLVLVLNWIPCLRMRWSHHHHMLRCPLSTLHRPYRRPCLQLHGGGAVWFNPSPRQAVGELALRHSQNWQDRRL